MLAECLSFLSTSIITAMYAIIPQQIPQGKRAEINEKILFAINSGKDMIPAESIYNCYTGIGGLHNLKQSDFASYHEYAEAKKEFEMGQFFTPVSYTHLLVTKIRIYEANSSKYYFFIIFL